MIYVVQSSCIDDAMSAIVDDTLTIAPTIVTILLVALVGNYPL